MKKLDYPTQVKVPVDVESGAKLDTLAVRRRQSRPNVLLDALEFFFARTILIRDREEKKRRIV